MSGDDEQTRQATLPSADEQATRAHADAGAVAELRARLGSGELKTLPLYTLSDQLVVGRGTATDWQIDDPSLSRKHCQLKWNGRELTVEDLGSANGTRVGHRPASTPLPVGPNDVVQLGAVTLQLVPISRNPDAEATRLVSAPTPPLAGVPTALTPPQRVPAWAPTPAFGVGAMSDPARPAEPRVPSPTPARGQPRPTPTPAPPSAERAVFRPERDAAGPDEPTRAWDPNAVFVVAPRGEAALWARLGRAWKTNRRPFVLAAAAAWMALLVALLYWKQPRPPIDEAPARPATPPAPVVTQLGRDPAAGSDVVEASTDRAADLEAAIAAYDNGRPDEALRYFRRLATDPGDEAARFMVHLIESKAPAP